jgi:hypothetical protein
MPKGASNSDSPKPTVARRSSTQVLVLVLVLAVTG